MLCKYVEQREVDVMKKKRSRVALAAVAACGIEEQPVTGQQQQQHHILFNYKNYKMRSNIVLPPIAIVKDDATSEKNIHTGAEKYIHTPTTEALVLLTPIKINNNSRYCIGRKVTIDTDKGSLIAKSPYDEYLQRRSLYLHRSPSRTVVNLFFDGGARPNPAPVGGAGYALFNYEGKCIAFNSVRIDWRETYRKKLINNHEAEYIGLIHGLKAALGSRVDCLVVMGDSELVVNQMNGVHEAQKDTETNLVLFRLHSHAALLKKHFRHIQFKWISRFRNSVADGLTKLAQLQEEPQHENANWFLPSLSTACILYS